MFSVHLNLNVCLTSCALLFGLKKQQQILGKYEGLSKITEPCLITFESSKMDI